MLEQLRGGLVVSCQPVDDGPMDDPTITAAMAQAAIAGGARGLRIEGIANLSAVRPLTEVPIVGIVKHDLSDSPVRITPFGEDVRQLARAGANIIAYDATARARPVPCVELVDMIKQAGLLAMADCASIDDGSKALAEGADLLGTTLSGYAYDLAPAGAAPDFGLIAQFKSLDAFVMAEGRMNTPHLARHAMTCGADCVTVGSAITRIEHITSWFADAIRA